mmetsp:Transcript_65923/g.157322  ORF Transcript_65923/g.157322 Transcript_65923/m.157322 type:complete len:574 (+) Transcript_65923:74-1795(+)
MARAVLHRGHGSVLRRHVRGTHLGAHVPTLHYHVLAGGRGHGGGHGHHRLPRHRLHHHLVLDGHGHHDVGVTLHLREDKGRHVLLAVRLEAQLLILLGHAEHADDVEDQEDERGRDHCPRHDHDRHDHLDTELLAALARVVGAAVLRVDHVRVRAPDARAPEAPDPDEAVHDRRVGRVIDLEHAEEVVARDVEDTAAHAREERVPRADNRGGGGDGHEAGEERVGAHEEVVLLALGDVGEDGAGQHGRSGGDEGVEADLGGNLGLAVSKGPGLRRVEAEHREPEEEDAGGVEEVVRVVDHLDLTVDETALAGTNPERAGEADEATHDVHHTRTSPVDHTVGAVVALKDRAPLRGDSIIRVRRERGHPPLTPPPVHHDGVEEGRVEEGEDKVRRDPRAPRHRAGDDGDREGGDGHLLEHELPLVRPLGIRGDGHAGVAHAGDSEDIVAGLQRDGRAVVALAVVLDVAAAVVAIADEAGHVLAEGERMAEEPPCDAGDRNHHHVLEQHDRLVLAVGGSSLDEADAELRGDDHEASDDKPLNIEVASEAEAASCQRVHFQLERRESRHRDGAVLNR